MPKIKIRTPADGTPWTKERLAVITTAHVQIDGELYPVTSGQLDGEVAVIVVDTGKTGPKPEPGTHTQAGTVE